MTVPIATLAPLNFANGSTSYTSPTGERVIGSVNGPVEVGRREVQNPEEATLEVLVKPGVGTSGPGERYVEGIIRGMLNRVVLMRDQAMARRGVVITLIVVENRVADGKIDERGGSYLSILPALLHTALLSLLSAGIPMAMIYTATLIAVSPSGALLSNPSTQEIKTSTSLHVLAFSSKGNLLLDKSQGIFDVDQWEKVYDLAENVCRGGPPGGQVGRTGGDTPMGGADSQTLEQFIRQTVEDKVRQDFRWKLDTA
ncbi:exosome non-catalytic core subunit rrp46 [Myotisia sp. PD_48]|nr:exosome non-catalytic core subunit rrp46 [Myotisia sp. PD_48]